SRAAPRPHVAQPAPRRGRRDSRSRAGSRLAHLPRALAAPRRPARRPLSLTLSPPPLAASAAAGGTRPPVSTPMRPRFFVPALLRLALAGPPAGAQGAPPETGTLPGRVVEDATGEGLPSATGAVWQLADDGAADDATLFT